jgi:Zn-dependent peptidase ImmA (M78 family)
LRRGFKTLAEKASASARQVLNLNGIDPLDPWAYAQHLKVSVLDFSSLGLSTDCIRQLTVLDEESWSAMTLKDDRRFAIVLNPAHAVTRQRNDLMHELAHIALKHVPARVDISPTGLLLLSDYSDEQEQEADWYAGALLLPRTGLMFHRSRIKTSLEIAQHYGVSSALCEWRLRITGVDVQLQRARP